MEKTLWDGLIPDFCWKKSHGIRLRRQRPRGLGCGRGTPRPLQGAARPGEGEKPGEGWMVMTGGWLINVDYGCFTHIQNGDDFVGIFDCPKW